MGIKGLSVIHMIEKLNYKIAVFSVILQEQHENQVKEIRKAGHDTLAVIVEEYKVVPLELNLCQLYSFLFLFPSHPLFLLLI